MTKIHFDAPELLSPQTSIELHPLLLAGGFWTSPTGFPKLVNLIIFLGLLYFLLRKPAREFFKQRFKSVREMLERAAHEKETAMAKMAELDARLNRLDAELAEIKSQAQQEAQAERERVKAETERDLERIRLSAQREVEAAKQIAMADLREFAATKSVELAEQIIRRELTSEDDARLVRRVGEEMGRVDS
jgi:F0F1-type ATP synthase membrane subunit b/b'